MAGLNLPFDIREVLFWFFLVHRKKCVFLFSHFMQDLVPVTLYNNLGVSPKPATLLLCTGYEELTYVIKNSTNSSLLSFPPTSCLMILLFLPQPMPVVHQNYAFLIMFVYFEKGKKNSPESTACVIAASAGSCLLPVITRQGAVATGREAPKINKQPSWWVGSGFKLRAKTELRFKTSNKTSNKKWGR